jgi:hypothetical protein
MSIVVYSEFQMKLAEQDFAKFHHLRPRMIEDAEAVLAQDIPRLMEALPRSLEPSLSATTVSATATIAAEEIPVASLAGIKADGLASIAGSGTVTSGTYALPPPPPYTATAQPAWV